MNSILSPLIQQVVTSISSVGKDGYGDSTFTLKYSNVRCRWQESTRQLVNKAGEQVLARAECWVEIDYSIAIGDKFIHDGESYLVINHSTKYDIFGNAEFIKVYLQ